MKRLALVLLPVLLPLHFAAAQVPGNSAQVLPTALQPTGQTAPTARVAPGRRSAGPRSGQQQGFVPNRSSFQSPGVSSPRVYPRYGVPGSITRYQPDVRYNNGNSLNQYQYRGNPNAYRNGRTNPTAGYNTGGVSTNRNGEGQRDRFAYRRAWSRTSHDRNWYRTHYTRFAVFGGGYYFLNGGYWYPAYGYDPYFTTYSYDAPIYSYNDQDPAQVIANVQTELQKRGYEPGAVDGTYGPSTRLAILNFQGDAGLPGTGEIDQATLEALGLQEQ